MTAFGYTCEPAATASHQSLYTSAGYRRFFFGPVAHVGWNRGPLATIEPDDYPVISVKNYVAEDFRILCQDAAAPFVFAINHEPEDEITRGTLTIERLRACYASARAIADGSDAQVRLAVILNWRQGRFKGFDWDRLAPVFEHAHLIAMDCYADSAQAAQSVYTDPGELLDPLTELADAYGLPHAVTEFGMTMAADADSERFARQLATYFACASLNGAEWLSYWCHTSAERDYHLENVSAEGMNVLRGAIAATA